MLCKCEQKEQSVGCFCFWLIGKDTNNFCYSWTLSSRIRLYNRSSMSSSQSTLQSCRHILTTEGPMAFYKGFSTHFMRIGPHFTLTFVFLGMLKRQLIEGQSRPAKISNILYPKDEIPIVVSSSSPSPSTPALAIVRQEQI